MSRTLAWLTAAAAGILVAVGSLQYALHVGSCGNGPNSLANGAPPCPGGMFLKILLGLAGLFWAIFCATRLGRQAVPLLLGIGFCLIGIMFAILGFVPAPGDDATPLGMIVGSPFFLGGLVALVVAARRSR